jgi:hypothetical protein
MDDSDMNNDDDVVDYNLVDLDNSIAGKIQNALKKGKGNPNGNDRTLVEENQSLPVNSDPLIYEPYVIPKLPRGSVEEIQNNLRTLGSRLRKDLNKSLRTDPQAWKALRRPASLHSAQRTLAEMLFDCPHADQEQFHELGDGNVYMSLSAMKKYLYPTLRVMQHLHSNKGQYDHVPGGVKSMIVY